MIGVTYEIVNTQGFNRLTIVGTDPFGSIIWRKDYGNFKFEYLDVLSENSVVKENNSFYLALCFRDSSNKHGSALLKFNYNGDSLWQKKYYDQPGVNLYAVAVTKSVDNGLLLTGFYADFNLSEEPALILKTDINGNELWRKKINKPVPNINRVVSVVQDSTTKKIVMVGFQYIGTSSNNNIYANILITDSIGNKIAQTTFNNSGGGGFGHIIQLRDNSYLSGGSWAINNNDYQAFLVKFNVDGVLVWAKKFPVSAPYNNIGWLYELSNTDIIMLGKSDTYWEMVPQIFRLDSSGNIKWSKYIGSPFNSNNPEYCRSMNATSDRGFIISSWFPYQQNSRPYSIIKIDSLGCDTLESYCKLISGQAELKNGFSFECFPIPADEKINFRIEAPAEKEFSVRLTDLTGKIVCETIIFPNVDNTLDVSAFRSGIYFLHLTYEGNTVEVKKISIVH